MWGLTVKGAVGGYLVVTWRVVEFLTRLKDTAGLASEYSFHPECQDTENSALTLGGNYFISATLQ